MGAIFVPTRFSLVRISVRDLVADGKSLLRNSGVGGGGENLILRKAKFSKFGGGGGDGGPELAVVQAFQNRTEAPPAPPGPKFLGKQRTFPGIRCEKRISFHQNSLSVRSVTLRIFLGSGCWYVGKHVCSVHPHISCASCLE